VSDLRELAGSIVVTGIPGDRLDPATRAALCDLRPGGVVLFDRNVSTLAATRDLVAAVRDAVRGAAPALACVDQEGGRVARLRFRDPGIPSMLGVGAAGDTDLAERAGAALADDLRAIGANVDFAPVLDLALAREGTVIGRRSFGDDPQRVAALGVAVVRGMQSRGVAASAKHFPGHGSTALDSHRELPIVGADLATLSARDLVPFAAAIAAGVDAVMTAHVLFTQLDPERPASLSPRILTGLLRDELHFDGVCVTDCLQMDAIARGVGSVRGGVLALAAGADALLVSHDVKLALALRDAIVAAVRDGDVPRARLEDAARRVAALRTKRAPAGDVPEASGASDDTAREVAARAVVVSTSVRVHGHATAALSAVDTTIPPDRPVTVVSFEGDASDGVADARGERPSLSLALRRRRVRSESMRVPLEPDDETISVLLDVLRAQGDRTIVLVARRADLRPTQARAIDAILDIASDAVGISALEPFDLFALARARAIVCSFGDDDANVDAIASVLVGEAKATGGFPVAVSIVSPDGRWLPSRAEIDARLPRRVRAPVAGAADALGDDAEAGGP
jgi:beta-N-acetylhexosaminidase